MEDSMGINAEISLKQGRRALMQLAFQAFP